MFLNMRFNGCQDKRSQHIMTKEIKLLKIQATFNNNMTRHHVHLSFVGVTLIGLYSIVSVFILYLIWYPNQPEDIIETTLAHAVSKGMLSPCNCTLDFVDDAVGFELPNVKIIKNESMQSQTEGRLEWTASKQLAMDGVLVGDIYLANQSSSALVDMNAIRVVDNQALGIEITGGTEPDIVRAEIVNPLDASMNITGLSLGDIVIDKKLMDYTISYYNKSLDVTSLEENSFNVRVARQGDYVLLLSLIYKNNSGNNDTASNISHIGDLTAIYKALLSVRI
jgi:hypothetical protein